MGQQIVGFLLSFFVLALAVTFDVREKEKLVRVSLAAIGVIFCVWMSFDQSLGLWHILHCLAS